MTFVILPKYRIARVNGGLEWRHGGAEIYGLMKQRPRVWGSSLVKGQLYSRDYSSKLPVLIA